MITRYNKINVCIVKFHILQALVEVKAKDQVLQATWEIHVLLSMAKVQGP